MELLAKSVNKFLEFNEYKILDNAGNISKLQAERKAIIEYDEFNKHQRIESDFDKLIKKSRNLSDMGKDKKIRKRDWRRS